MDVVPPFHGTVPPAARPLHALALDYLLEVMGPAGHPGTSGGMVASGAPAPRDARGGRRGREWSRRWSRLCLPQLLSACSRDLAAARTADQVYAALPGHAARIVGAFTCLLFVRAGAGPLRALPDGRLRTGAERLHLPPLRRPRRVTAPDAAPPRGRFASLAPLFSDDGVHALACAPLGPAGALALVERRRERVFDGEDWALIALLAAEAQAALQRIRACAAIPALAGADLPGGLAGRPQLDAVLEHAWRVVLAGEPLTLVLLSLEGSGAARAEWDGAAAEGLVRGAAEALRACMPPEGLALRYGPAELLLVLPGVAPAQAAAAVERLRRRLALRVQVHAGIAGPFPDARGPRDLLHGVAAAVPRRAREGA